MEITFKDKGLEKITKDPRKLRKRFNQAAEIIENRIKLLISADNLGQIHTGPPTRLHLLKGDLKGKYAIDVNRKLRMVLEINQEPIPLHSNNSVNINLVTKILIVEIIDYH